MSGGAPLGGPVLRLDRECSARAAGRAHASEEELARMRSGDDGLDMATAYRHLASCPACRARLRQRPQRAARRSAPASPASLVLALALVGLLAAGGRGGTAPAGRAGDPGAIHRAPDAWTMASF